MEKHYKIVQNNLFHCFEKSWIVESNESGIEEESGEVDLQKDNGIVIYDLNDFIRKNLVTIET